MELTDQATGNVVADTIKLVAAPNVTNRATWTPTISTSDSYLVYTRWTSHPNRATDATYTVHHQGGSTPVVVNQQVNGGEWYLLGTYNLDPSSNHRIELSDEANGVVVADAVYIVPSSVAQDSVTWEPTLASSELVDVYAKWVEDGDRSSQVSYTVHHSGGSSVINMNQRANGGVWNWLGRFTMNPSSNHRVEVTDSTVGVVVADAVRFVSVTTSGAGLMYVHSDHLRTPQKMTNESQALVWDAVYEPFGETHSITGTALNNQRFPGQYFDQESGFSYNYFRDYDPTTGRFLTSDPKSVGEHVGGDIIRMNTTKLLNRIGITLTTPSNSPPLELNTYRYSAGNPLRWIDPDGLSSLVYNRGAGSLCVFDRNGQFLGCCDAGNNTTSSSNGPWPNGSFPYSHYKPHPESGPTGRYGSHGNLVFSVPGRSGMGVHSGRNGPDSPTLGCIRTDDTCMQQLVNIHANDPITDITVR